MTTSIELAVDGVHVTGPNGSFTTDLAYPHESGSGDIPIVTGETMRLWWCEQSPVNENGFEVLRPRHQYHVRDGQLTLESRVAAGAGGAYQLAALAAPTATRLTMPSSSSVGEIDMTAGRVVFRGANDFDTADSHLHLTKYFQGQVSISPISRTPTLAPDILDTTIGSVSSGDNIAIGAVRHNQVGQFFLPNRWQSIGQTVLLHIHADLTLHGNGTGATQMPTAVYLLSTIIEGGSLKLRRYYLLSDQVDHTDMPAFNIEYRIWTGQFS